MKPRGPVIVTGASGFVGQHLMPRLRSLGIEAHGVSSKDCDLTDLQATLAWFQGQATAEHLIHLASFQAAGDFPAKNPGSQLDRNTRIHTNVLEAWRQICPQARLTAVGTSCAYTDSDDGKPYQEKDYMEGAVHGSVYAYAMTKRLLYTGIQAYNDQYGLNGSFLIPATMFGEFDDFHTDTAHVCGALINRFSRAAREGEAVVEVWGTGQQVRDFMDVEDFVEVLIQLLPQMNRATLNIGPGVGTSIEKLATMIGRCCGFAGEIRFDADRYEGVKTKVIDCSQLHDLYAQEVSNELQPGLLRTANWYRRNYADYQDKIKFPRLVCSPRVAT